MYKLFVISVCFYLKLIVIVYFYINNRYKFLQMKISEVIKNITEIQEPNWVNNLLGEDVEKIEDNFWLVWMKLKSIDDKDIIEPLLKISEFLSLKEMKDGKLTVKSRKVDFRTFYSLSIGLIPKKKYKFINPKKKKKKDYDYEFLKLMAKDLKESVHNCEDYYDIYSELGILEDEKIKLFNKYGIEYQSKSTNKTESILTDSIEYESTDTITSIPTDTIQNVDINSIKEHPKNSEIYTKSRNEDDNSLMENIRIYGLLQPIIVDKNTDFIISGNRRYKCCKKLGMNKIQVIKKEIEFDVINLINFNRYRDKSQIERVNEYRVLKREIKKLGYKDRKKLMEGVKMREYIYQQTGTSQSQNYRLEYIEKNNLKLYNKVLEGQISIKGAYNELKGMKSGKNDTVTKNLKTLEIEIEKISPFVDKETIIKMIDKVYD